MYSVSKHFGCRMDFFYCFFCARRLEPLYTLSHFGITNGCTIYVMHKMRGGGNTGPTAKRMALGTGGAISQNIEHDQQPPGIWDIPRAICINIQIINTLDFEDATGLVAPPTPISFDTYKNLGIPFFNTTWRIRKPSAETLVEFSLWTLYCLIPAPKQRRNPAIPRKESSAGMLCQITVPHVTNAPHFGCKSSAFIWSNFAVPFSNMMCLQSPPLQPSYLPIMLRVYPSSDGDRE